LTYKHNTDNYLNIIFKNVLRNSSGQERRTGLALDSSECAQHIKINTDEVIARFAKEKRRTVLGAKDLVL